MRGPILPCMVSRSRDECHEILNACECSTKHKPNATNPNRGQMIRRLSIAVLIAASLVATAIASAHTSTAASKVKAVYKSVMLAEYFGPQSAVCGNLTSEGVKEFKLETATSSCAKAFKANQHVLKHKQPGNDNSGYSKPEWRTAVKQFVSALKVRIHGSKAKRDRPEQPRRRDARQGRWPLAVRQRAAERRFLDDLDLVGAAGAVQRRRARPPEDETDHTPRSTRATPVR